MAMQGLLRPRGPTLNFPLDPKKMEFIREEKSLLSELTANGSKESTVVVDNVLQKRSEFYDALSKQFEIRQPEMSPITAVPHLEKVTEMVKESAGNGVKVETKKDKDPEPLKMAVEKPVEQSSNGHAPLIPSQKITSMKTEEKSDVEVNGGRKRQCQEQESSVQPKKEKVNPIFLNKFIFFFHIHMTNRFPVIYCLNITYS